MTDSKTGFDPTQIAVDWLARNVHTVPLRSRSKRPKNKAWTHLRLVEEDFERGVFKPGDNIGALWGSPSDGATDLDLDMDEACEVAPYILPETFIYGRTGKEWSHYVYQVIGSETRKWQLKELGTIVEIRSDGAQSVIPPSRHPEGGFYFIHEDGTFTKLSKLDLERYADEIAVAAVFLYYYPEAGSRHDYVHACTGALCHQSWPDEKILRVMGAVLTVIQGEDDELKDRMGSVKNTIEHHKIGDRTRGFRSLEAWMKGTVIEALRRWTQSGAREGQIVIAPPKAERQQDALKFDPELLEVPGLVGEVSKWALRESYIEQPIFGLAAGIMCTALASANHYLVSAWDTPLQPYLMVTAPTGGGKNNALRAVSRFGRSMGLEDVVFRGFQSYYAMLDILGEEGMACWIWDEAARYMAAAKNPSGQDFQILTHVISLYGQAADRVDGTPGRRQNIPALDHPFLTVLATAQPDVLMEALTSAARETGFVNRFILFDTGSDFPPVNTRRKKLFPSAIKKQARMLLNHEPKKEFTEIEFWPMKTFTRFQEFEDICRRRNARGDHTWGRSNQNALILAGIAAIGIDPHKPVITHEICDWAIKLITWSNNCWDERIRFTASGSGINEKESIKVEGIIAHPEKFLAKTTSSNQRMCLREGLVPKSVLVRETRNIQRHRLEQILNDLHEAKLVGSTEKHNNPCYFTRTPLKA